MNLKYLLLIVLCLGLGACASAPAFAVHSTLVTNPAAVIVTTDPIPVSDELDATVSASIDLDTLAPAFRLQIDMGTPEAALACGLVRMSIPERSADVAPKPIPGTGRIVFSINQEDLADLIGLSVCGRTVDLDTFRQAADLFISLVDAIRGALS